MLLKYLKLSPLVLLASCDASVAESGVSPTEAGLAISKFKKIEISNTQLGECIKKSETVQQCFATYEYIVPEFRNVGPRQGQGTYSFDRVPGGYVVIRQDS